VSSQPDSKLLIRNTGIWALGLLYKIDQILSVSCDTQNIAV